MQIYHGKHKFTTLNRYIEEQIIIFASPNKKMCILIRKSCDEFLGERYSKSFELENEENGSLLKGGAELGNE